MVERKKTYLIESFSIIGEEDDYNDGASGNYVYDYFEKVNKTFNNKDEILEWINKNFVDGISWNDIEEEYDEDTDTTQLRSGMLCNYDAYNGYFWKADAQEIYEWKNGDKILYSFDITINVSAYRKTAFAKGGKTQSKISVGDLVHIPSMNKSGVVTNIISQGKHYTVAFVDGSKYVADAKELEIIHDDSDYMAKGGLTEHGLKLNDTIKSGGHIGKTTVRVHNSNNGDYMVDLDKGKRTKLEYNRKTKKYEKTMAKGGNVYSPAIVVVNKSDKSQEETIYINNIKDGADLIYEIEQAVGDNYEVTEVEGIPESFLSRDNINRIDMDESEWDAVINAWDASQTSGIDFEVLGDVYSDYSPSNMSDFINENYEGYFANEEDLARHYVDMVGWDGIGNDAQQRYFDYESFGMDLSHDYSEYKGHYFRTYKKGGKIGKYNLNKYLKTKTMKKGGATKKPQMGDPSLKTNPYWSDPKHTKFSKRKRLPVIRTFSDDEAFEYGHGGEAYAKGGSMKQSQWGKYIDSGLRAKRAGKRKSPSGGFYYENRPNRSDKDPKKKLAQGGNLGGFTYDIGGL